MSQKTHTPQTRPFRWDGVSVLAYKPDGGTHFRDITRQVLFDDASPHGVQLRYFEIAPGGHSTLEWHEHTHAVVVLRGRGRALVGSRVHTLGTRDLVRVPPRTWHQFRAGPRTALGFLCVVPTERDKPRRPTPADLRRLRAHPAVRRFVRV